MAPSTGLPVVLLSEYDRGRLHGLEEAASILVAASTRVSEARIVSPSRTEQRARGFNTGLLLKVASLVRRYAEDIKSGKKAPACDTAAQPD